MFHEYIYGVLKKSFLYKRKSVYNGYDLLLCYFCDQCFSRFEISFYIVVNLSCSCYSDNENKNLLNLQQIYNVHAFNRPLQFVGAAS